MNFITDVILPLALAFIMFTLGLGLTFSDFARVARMPKNFLIGLVSQLIFLPLVALIIVFVWPLQPELAIGLIVATVLMQLYILFRGTEATWAFFNFMFIVMTIISGASFYGFEIDKLGLTKGSSREGYLSTGALALLWGILCFGLADKIYI